jgi:hypothetical protein
MVDQSGGTLGKASGIQGSRILPPYEVLGVYQPAVF